MVAAALQVEVPQPRAPRGRTGALIVLVFSLARRQFPPYLGIRPGLWYCKCSSETVLLLPSVFNGSLQLTGEPHHCRNGPLVGVGGLARVSWRLARAPGSFESTASVLDWEQLSLYVFFQGGVSNFHTAL